MAWGIFTHDTTYHLLSPGSLKHCPSRPTSGGREFQQVAIHVMNDCHSLTGRPGALTLDEVQRAPDLLLAVKRAVDRSRVPGRFVLTGSTDLLLLKTVSESLAGRASYLSLWPMTRRERAGLGVAGLWGQLFENPVDRWRDLLASDDARAADWRGVALEGGYPVPAISQDDPADRAVWFEGYVRTYLERDLQDVSSIDNLVDFRRLIAAACHRIGQLVNQTELGRDVQLSQPTVRRWLNLLAASYQIVRLPAYSINRTKRLIKTPKIYWSDTGLALHMAKVAPGGAHLENLILTDLIVWRDAELVDRPELFYWRTAVGEEVDLVMERGDRLLAIEVKGSSRPTARDARHLRSFREEYGDRVHGCLLLHDGTETTWLGPGILSTPWWRVI